MNYLIQMIAREGYGVNMDQVLNFSRESFGRLLAVLEPQVAHYCHVNMAL